MQFTLARQFVVWIMGGAILASVIGLSLNHGCPAPDVYSAPQEPETGLCQIRIADLALIYFTYCLVIVGYFTIKRSERTIQDLERAHFFGGTSKLDHDGQNNWYVEVSFVNQGRTSGIFRSIYWQFSAEEPKGAPNYAGGNIKRMEFALVSGGDSGMVIREKVPQDKPYFYGTFIYEDIFRRVHTNRFCQQLDLTTGLWENTGPAAWNEFD
jgi:hypothetical protein